MKPTQWSYPPGSINQIPGRAGQAAGVGRCGEVRGQLADRSAGRRRTHVRATLKYLACARGRVTLHSLAAMPCPLPALQCHLPALQGHALHVLLSHPSQPQSYDPVTSRPCAVMSVCPVSSHSCTLPPHCAAGECTICGDVRVTPFYDVEKVMAKLQSYVEDLNANVNQLPTRGPCSKCVPASWGGLSGGRGRGV